MVLLNYGQKVAYNHQTCLALGMLRQDCPERMESKMIYCGKHLLTGDGKTHIKDAAAVVGKNGKIQDVGTKAEMTKKYPGEEVKEYGDATLLPGLCDMHVHFGYYYSQPDQYDTYNIHDQLLPGDCQDSFQ